MSFWRGPKVIANWDHFPKHLGKDSTNTLKPWYLFKHFVLQRHKSIQRKQCNYTTKTRKVWKGRTSLQSCLFLFCFTTCDCFCCESCNWKWVFVYRPGCNPNLPFCRGSKIAFCSAKEKNIHRWYLSVGSKTNHTKKTKKQNLLVNCDAGGDSKLCVFSVGVFLHNSLSFWSVILQTAKYLNGNFPGNHESTRWAPYQL